MGDKIYVGAAVNVAEVGKINIGGTIAVGNTFTVTLGKASVTFTTTTTVVADAVAGILALVNAATARNEFQNITWTSGTGYVQGTGPSDGYPWIDGLSVAKAQGSGGTNTHTISITTVTAGTGNLFWDNTGNWAGGVIPVAGDTIHIGLYGVVPKYKISRAGLGSLCTLIIYSGSTSGLMIGLPETNAADYPEYLNRYLNIRAKLTYGQGTGQYVPKLNFLLDHVIYEDVTHTVQASDNRDSTGKSPLQICGRSSGSYAPSFDVNGGNVDLSLEEGETVYSNQLKDIRCSGSMRVYGKWNCLESGILEVKGEVFWGSTGSGSNTYSTPKTIRVISGGILRVGRTNNSTMTAAGVENLSIEPGAVVYWNRTDNTHTAINVVENSGTLDFREDLRKEKIIGTLNAYPGSQTWNTNGTARISYVNLVQASLQGQRQATIDLGNDKTLRPIGNTCRREFTLVYRTGGTAAAELEIAADLAGPQHLSIYATDSTFAEFFSNLVGDPNSAKNGSVIELTDGSDRFLFYVYGTDIATPFLLNTWFYNGGAEFFPDGTTITLRQLV